MITQQVMQFTQAYGCAPVWQIAIDLEQMVDRAIQPGKFRGLYWRWYGKHIRDTLHGASYKIPRMVKRLRETQDMVEFGMIICFLSEYHATAQLSLAYVLDELPLNE